MRPFADQKGFTIVELLWGMLIAALLMGLGAQALRTYWMRQGLVGGASQIVTQMKNAQQGSVAETHPIVYGVRFRVNESEWAIIRYDPKASECKEIEQHDLEAGAYVHSASFSDAPAPQAVCVSAFPGNVFAFFYPRGSATEGSVVLRSRQTAGERTISVAGITGRVTSQ